MNQFSFSNLKKDLPAGLVVFLVALPLCLGVALASGAPLIAGLISGLVGGIVVGSLSGSHSSVSGPAAGLTAIVLAAITQLGFEAFLVAIMIAGLLQIGLGLIKAGIIASYFPSSVIKGLLAAIGLILILKQIPHAVGYDKDAEGDFSFFQMDGENTFSELLKIFEFITPGAAIIGISSIVLLIVWEKTRLKKLQVPAPLIIVIFGVALNEIFRAFSPGLLLGPEHLVQLPDLSTSGAIRENIYSPDWSALTNLRVYAVAVGIAIVASLETLLNLEAIDKLDEQRRDSPPNRELMAQGVGNLVTGFLGGLPVTSVVVRSSVNLNAGARTKVSAIFHGILILVSAVFIPDLLNRIPLAALAGILIFTGYKLTSIAVIKKVYSHGWSQFLPFIATLLAIVFTDLLFGIFIGLNVGIFFILKSDLKSGFRYFKEKFPAGEVIRLKISQHATFLNKASFISALNDLPKNTEVVLDATDTDYIDHDVLEIIRDFKDESQQRNITVSMVGFREEYEIPDSIQFVDVLTRELQQEMTPHRVLEILREGNERFVSGHSRNKDFLRQVKQTFREQHPMAAVLGCIDSRSTSELIFDLGLGDILNARIAGNVVNNEIIASLEYSTKVAGAKLIVVLGHTNCGAIKAACDHIELGNITGLLARVQPALDAETETLTARNSTNQLFVERVTHLNVKLMMEEIRKGSALIDEMLTEGSIGMVGAMHDLRTGFVSFTHFNKEWE